MGTLANSEDFNDMPLYGAFHQGLQDKIDLQRKKKKYVFGNFNLYPLIYTIDQPDSIACSFMENSIDLKRVIMPFAP